MNAGLAETPAGAPGRRVVVGVDGSDGSKDALRWAARIAQQEGAVLDVIATWDFPDAVGWDGGLARYSPQQDIENSLKSTLDEVFGGRYPGRMRTLVMEGDAAQTILTVAEGALMVVVGSRGHSRLAGLLLGSVSTKVAGHAGCPVLVVHGAPPR